ncbi:MAG: hypothetical protein C0622_10190 [Desulfuromonas sp.]|nr:MAG: hypothetical protein C0622_10190 [Desulfuromonas sp.]
MSWADVKEYLDYLRTDQVMERLQNSNIGDLTTNPWFYAGFAAVILITYFMNWKKISAFIVGIGGFVLALSMAIGKGTGVEGIESGGIWIMVGGGVLVIGLFIYILFIKAE